MALDYKSLNDLYYTSNATGYNHTLGQQGKAKGFWDWMADPGREQYDPGDVASSQKFIADSNLARNTGLAPGQHFDEAGRYTYTPQGNHYDINGRYVSQDGTPIAEDNSTQGTQGTQGTPTQFGNETPVAPSSTFLQQNLSKPSPIVRSSAAQKATTPVAGNTTPQSLVKPTMPIMPKVSAANLSSNAITPKAPTTATPGINNPLGKRRMLMNFGGVK